MGDDEYYQVFPRILFAIRDFGLDLPTAKSREEAEKLYLEGALMPRKEQTDTIRESLNKCFPPHKRTLFTISHPGISKASGIASDDFASDQSRLSEEFRDDMLRTVEHIMSTCPNKEIRKEPLDGRGTDSMVYHC